jgi:hypothetical protein
MINLPIQNIQLDNNKSYATLIYNSDLIIIGDKQVFINNRSNNFIIETKLLQDVLVIKKNIFYFICLLFSALIIFDKYI